MTEQQLSAAGFTPLPQIGGRAILEEYQRGTNRILDLCYGALDAYWDRPYCKQENGSLQIFVNEPEGYLALPPIGGDFHDGIAHLQKLFRAAGEPIYAGYFTAEQAQASCLAMDCDERFGDYICKREELTALTWKYKHKTADYNAFLRTISPRAVPVSPAVFEDCRAVLSSWCANRNCADCLFLCEKDVLERYLLHMEHNGMRGLLVYDGKMPIGLLLYYETPNMLFYPFCKTDKRYNGLSVWLYVEAARTCASEYVNLGSDGGIAGLKRFKDKFRPYEKVNKFFTKL